MKLINDKLTEKTIPFDFVNPPMNPHDLISEMSDVMVQNRGIGLAANQIGYPWSVFILGTYLDRENIISVFNPILVDSFGEEVYIEEGCLSYPGLFLKIKRPSNIRVRYTTVKGNTDTVKFEGLTARIFQHEFDHLQGIDFRKRATYYHYQKAIKDMKLLNRKKRKIGGK